MLAHATKDFRLRAYIAKSTVAFMHEKLGHQKTEQLLETLTPAAQHTLGTAKAADWIEVTVQTEVLRALAATAEGNEDRARQLLIESGEYVAREATNTFLKLLMKMLTPTLFAKKLPDFWKRDSTCGRLEVEATDQKLICRMLDIEGFDHVPCTCAGFLKFALGAMGKSIDAVTVHGWSLAKPAASGAFIEFSWKD